MIVARRRYSDDDRAAAVAAVTANNGNVQKTANELGLPHQTLVNWVKCTRRPEATIMSVARKLTLAEALEEVAWKLLDSLPDKIDGSSLSMTAVAMGIAIDKARLLRGEPTAILEDRGAGKKANAFRALYVEVTSERTAVVVAGDDPPQPLPQGQAPDQTSIGLPGPDVP